MGNMFDNQQVNNFLVNQEVMSTCKNKFLLFIKIRSITICSTLNLYQECQEFFYEIFRLHFWNMYLSKCVKKSIFWVGVKIWNDDM